MFVLADYLLVDQVLHVEGGLNFLAATSELRNTVETNDHKQAG